VTVTLDNDAPELTAPLSSQSVGTDTTFAATAAGGAVEFLVDGTPRAVDTSAPFAAPVTGLSEGAHSASVQSCDANGAVCDGAASTPIAFVVVFLHPAITSVSPSPFSGNGDGRNDLTTMTFVLERRQSVTWRIMDADEITTEKGPLALGSLPAGTYAYTWTGLDNSHHVVADGTYSMVLETARTVGGALLTGRAKKTFVSDISPPTVCCGTGSGSKFYPYPDGYRDTFSPTATVGDSTRSLTLNIKSSTGSVVRRVTRYLSADGTYAVTWDGKDSAGRRVASGTYFARLTAGGETRTQKLQLVK
jgi:hypothetical protein